MPEATFTFPQGFVWGTATAAHQVEGGNRLNDWWAFEQKQDGGVHNNEVSGAACEWWEGRAEEDIERMAHLNTRAHRLSIEWSRIEPRPGRWSYPAIDRYREILSAMRKAGISPMVTLHHFTNPIWVAERGGWTHPESSVWFQRFVEKAVGELTDLCDTWCTINEPNVYAANSYFSGEWPPRQESMAFYFQVLENQLKGHAAAYHTIHDLQPHAQVGLAKHLIDWHPMNPSSPFDRLLSRLLDRFFNSITLDALETGVYNPLGGRKHAIAHLKGTLDWVGLNFYQRFNARFDFSKLRSLGIDYGVRPDAEATPGGWGELSPESLLPLIKQLYQRFRLPVTITENGIPDRDDKRRPSHLLQSLHAVWRACMFNYPVTGYYYWSLVDNFEWTEGYDPDFSFGLYAVDFATQQRTLKRSGELYREICAANAFNTDMTRRYAPNFVDVLFPREDVP